MGLEFKLEQTKVDQLMAVISENIKKPGPLMPTLHKAQSIFGCIPVEVQKIISNELNISVSKINGVVTFYSQFSIEPKGEKIIGICLGTACYVRGAQSIIDKYSKTLKIGVGETSADGKFTLEATRCIGACGLAPVLTIGDDVHGNLTVSTAEAALAPHLGGTLNE